MQIDPTLSVQCDDNAVRAAHLLAMVDSNCNGQGVPWQHAGAQQLGFGCDSFIRDRGCDAPGLTVSYPCTPRGAWIATDLEALGAVAESTGGADITGGRAERRIMLMVRNRSPAVR